MSFCDAYFMSAISASVNACVRCFAVYVVNFVKFITCAGLKVFSVFVKSHDVYHFFS